MNPRRIYLSKISLIRAAVLATALVVLLTSSAAPAIARRGHGHGMHGAHMADGRSHGNDAYANCGLARTRPIDEYPYQEHLPRLLRQPTTAWVAAPSAPTRSPALNCQSFGSSGPWITKRC